MSGNARRILWILIFVISISCQLSLAQAPVQLINNNVFLAENAVDTVVTILLASDGQANAVGTGVVVRPDGYILTAYHLVKGAREIQIRLRNGETFDKAEIVSTDERRNVVLLRVNATGLRCIPIGTFEESQVGTRIFVIANPSGQAWINKDNLLKSVQLADSIQGAGNGYRVLQFDAITNGNSAGGLVLDERGRSLGIITTNPSITGQNIAVPFSSVLGLIRSVVVNNSQTNLQVYPSPTTSSRPYPIPQGSVLMPERGVTPLMPKGPGSVVVKPHNIAEILAASKTIYVMSDTVFFKPQHLVNALLKRKEIDDWGLSFVEERGVADLILEIDHVLFTYKFTFKLYSQRLGSIIATGDAIIFDGNLGAPKMASRVIEKLTKVHDSGKKNTKEQEKDRKPDKKETN